MFVNNVLPAPVNKAVTNLDEHIKESLVYKQSNSSSFTFDYLLNDKTAKSKLVKAAKRTHLEIEENSTSTNLIFSAGAWAHSVLPSVKFWSEIQGEQSFKIDDYEISIGGVKTGKEASGKQVSTQVIFYGNRDKIVLHLYNTTQLILVNGHGYKKFIDLFLKPFFLVKTSQCLEEIGNFNVDVIDKLGPKTVKRSDIKYKKGSAFSCSGCEFAAKSISALKNHKIMQHTLSLNSPKLPIATNQTTKSSSKVERMMLEDASVSGLTDDDSVEEVTLKYTCFDCNLVTTSKGEIDDHIAEKHAPEPNEEVRILCTDCEQVFGVEDDYNSHVKTHKKETVNEEHEENVLKELYNKVMMDIIEHDIDKQNQSETPVDDTKILMDCKKCNFVSNDESEIRVHNQTIHTEVRINIESGNNIKCDQCQYVCKYNIQLKKHMKNVHGSPIFECSQCDFEAIVIADLWKHKFHEHEPETMEFSTPKDIGDFKMLFNLIHELKSSVCLEITQLKSCLGEVFDKIMRAFATSDNNAPEMSPRPSSPSPISMRPRMSSPSPVPNSRKPQSPSPQKQPKQKSNMSQAKRLTPYQRKPSVLLVWDSLSQNLDFRKIEAITNTTIKTAKGYSLASDGNPGVKHINLSDVSKEELRKKHYDNLVLAAPTEDISKLKTDKIKSDDNIDELKDRIKVSCKNVVKAAEDALANNSELKSVLIMNHAPRRDIENIDPMGIKSELAVFANHYLLELWFDSPHKQNITIGSHSLESSEKTLRNRQTDERTGRYDGIHYHGNSGRIAFTQSVLNMMLSSMNINPKYRENSITLSLDSDEDHTNCPQAWYMSKEKRKTNRMNIAVTQYQPIVTRNRFSVFNSNQGNL